MTGIGKYRPRLLAPGPVEVPPAVLAAMAKPTIHHRSPEFAALLERIRSKIAEVAFVPGDDVMILTASGTAAFESGLTACVPAGAKVLALHAGKFGARWATLARHHGYRVEEHSLPWGEAIDANQVADELRKHPDVSAVLVVHSETSTGTLHDIQAISKAVHDTVPEALLLVDCITSLTVAELRPNEWQLDGIFSGSQKGFMSPPGLSMAWLSERAWEHGAKAKTGFYLDLRKERDSQREGQCAYTPAVNLFYALEAAVEILLAEGIETIWQRRAHNNFAILAGAEAIGCKRFAARVSPAVAALRAPEKIMAPLIVKGFADRGVRISAGQDHTRDVLFRPSVLGYADSNDAVLLVAVLEDVLRELGSNVQHGVGVAAAMRALESQV